MQHLRLLAGTLLLTLLTACATSSARRGFEALPLLSPASFGAEATGVQRLTLSRLAGGQPAGDPLVLDAAVEVDAAALRVAGVLLGQRILLLGWDGKVLEEQREPVVPQALEGRAILRDLQLVYCQPAPYAPCCHGDGNCRNKRRGAGCCVARRWCSNPSGGDAAPLGNASLWNHVGQYRIDIESSNESR